MAHWDTEHDRAQGDASRKGCHAEPQAPGKHHHRGPDESAEGAAEEAPGQPSCSNEISGWPGAHRHGPVRPRTQLNRRLRPPGRWC